MDCNIPGFTAHHQLPEFTQTCPSSQWCHPTISSSVIPYSSCLQTFPAAGSSEMNQFFASGGQSIGISASGTVFPMNIRDWFPLGWSGWLSLLSKGFSRIFSNNHSSKASILHCSAFFIVQLSIHTWLLKKNIALTRQIFDGKVMSLLLYILLRLVIAFLPRSKHLSISWLQSISAVILESKKINFVTVFIFSPSICHEVMGPDVMILVFWKLSLKPALSLSSFTFIKRLFSSSLLSAIWVVSSAYLRLFIFLPTILILACASSRLAFHMRYSAYKLNKQGDNIQLWCTPFPIWKYCVIPCPVLSAASWPAYRFLRSQIRWSGIPISWRIFHSLLWSTQAKAWHSQ